MKKLLLLLLILLASNCLNAQKVVRIVIGNENSKFLNPVKCFRYDSIEVDILVWKFQKKLDEAWNRTVSKKIFDFDFSYELIKAKNDAQDKIKEFNFELYSKEWELYQGLSDEIRGPYKTE